MPENLMNSAHKATNDRYRENYEATFRGKQGQDCDIDCDKHGKASGREK